MNCAIHNKPMIELDPGPTMTSIKTFACTTCEKKYSAKFSPTTNIQIGKFKKNELTTGDIQQIEMQKQRLQASG